MVLGHSLVDAWPLPLSLVLQFGKAHVNHALYHFYRININVAAIIPIQAFAGTQAKGPFMEWACHFGFALVATRHAPA